MLPAPSRVLVLNAGSSTFKWALLPATGPTPIAEGSTAWTAADAASRAAQIRTALAAARAFDAVGHRVVHGGFRFRASVRIDDTVRRALDDLVEIDPLHMPPALAAIDAVAAAFPAVPQVAAFDTAFHGTMSEAAAGYGLPYEWTARYGIRRFGFHGLSVDHAVTQATALLGRQLGRLVVCHLGSGCSVTAVAGGRSVDTTMGFTPLDGVVMATRAGSVDPGLLLHLQLRHGVDAPAMLETLGERSGLLGLSGVSGDLREVVAAMDGGNARATLAYERFVLSVRRAIGQMSGVLGGVDVLAFTGGIGEHSARVRRDTAAAAGARLDDARNAAVTSDGEVSAADSPVRVVVIRAREDLVVRREVLQLCAAG